MNSAFLDTLGQTAWTIDVIVNGVDLNFKVDTGAEVTAISEESFQSLGKVELLKHNKKHPVWSNLNTSSHYRTNKCHTRAW